MNRFLALASLLLASCSPASPPELRLSDAWVRATVPGQTSTAAYLTIANEGGAADTLVAVTLPVPSVASLHQTTSSDGIARMRPLADGLEMPAGETVTLAPGGAHIMIEKLAEPLAAGETLRLTLRFARSGERALDVPIRVGAPDAGHQE